MSQFLWFFRFVTVVLFLAGSSVLHPAEPRLNEFTADNKNGLSDEDGEEVDWLEIYNPNPVALDLTGWFLSDTSALPRKWEFPAVSINANDYLVLFASGKDRRVPGENLHTNFSLRAAGEELLLSKPDGTVVSQFTFGPQQPDVSYGVTSTNATSTTLIGPQAPGWAFVPGSDGLGTAWTDPAWNDYQNPAYPWTPGLMDVGYEAGTGYESLLGLDVRSAMSGHTSCYIRVPFSAVDLSHARSLTLRMRYDDGFAAYLNGTLMPTASRNAPADPAWDSEALEDHPDGEAVQYEEINISQHLGLLGASGPNVLAVHGLNRSVSSSDFLIGPQLVLSQGTFSEGFMTTPSPGRVNAAGVQGLVGDTHFSVDRGFFTAPVEVAITCNTPDTIIHYTRNGDTPTATTGFVYTGPVVIETTTVLRAAAFRQGWLPSNVDTHSYFFLEDILTQSSGGSPPAGWPGGYVNNQRFDYGMDPEVLNLAGAATLKQALMAIPTVSLVTDLSNLTDPATGIYVNAEGRGAEAERPVSLEILHDPLNPAPGGFQQNAGLRIRGGFSRAGENPKHSWRLFFRNHYGKGKMTYPLFGKGSPAAFNGFDLRTSQDASWAYLASGENTFLRDESARSTQVEMMPGSRMRYLHVYVNGQYWGLYNTDERPNAGYGEQYFGGKAEDYDVMKSSGYPGGHSTEATDGTMEPGSAWHQLWLGARTVRAVPSNGNYFRLMGLAADGVTPVNHPILLDAANLADYLTLLFYMGGNDGPVSDYVGASNNWFGLRNRHGDRGFAFFVHDFEQSLGLEDGCNQRVGDGEDMRPWSDRIYGVNDYSRSNPEFIHEDLAWNLEYRVLFGDRVHRHLFNGGAMTDARVLSRMQGLAAQIDTAIWAESARWGDSARGQPFVRQDWLEANGRLYNFINAGTRQGDGTGRRDLVLQQLRRYDSGAKPLYPLLEAPVFSQHGGVLPPDGLSLTMALDNPGNAVVLYTTDGRDPRAAGGSVAAFALTYHGPVDLNDWTTTVKARVLKDGVWSALNEAVFTRSGLPPLLVSEIMARPAGLDAAERAAGFQDKDDFEFIELFNTGSGPLNLRNVQGVRGVTFQLSDIILAPGERTVVVHRLAAFRQRYGAGPAVAGTFTGSLDDGGELLSMTSAAGQILTEFSYGSSAWPSGLTGLSLTLRHPGEDPAAPLSWRSSVLPGGSPSGTDSVPYAVWKENFGITDEQSDPDGDGLVPLLEYASGGSPQADDSAHQPSVRLDPPAVPGENARLVFSYFRQRGADDVNATLRQSTDLENWTALAAEVTSITALPDGTERVRLQMPAPPAGGARLYLQLHWELSP